MFDFTGKGRAGTMSDIGYSYLRFSDPKQGKGDSIRRQKQATEDWCKRNNVVLDTSVKLEDKGRSAFKRDDFDKYALAEFLRMIERGRVKKGSYLIIENLDRLSREHVRSGATLCFRILDAGVSIVTTSPEKVYRHDSEDLIDIVMMVMELSRGHSESVIKSERVKQAWGKRKLDIASKPLKELLPLWLDVKGGRVVKRPDRVAVVKRIFRLTRDGSGFGAIMRKLNAEGVPVFKPRVKGSIKSLWQKSSLAVLIRNKAVLGKLEVDGEEKDLLPRIISDDDFYAAQVAVAKRRGSGGRERSMARNLFTSLVVDGDDNSRWSLANGGTNSEKRKYIENVAGQQGGAARKALPYDLFEAIILRHLREVRVNAEQNPQPGRRGRPISLSAEREVPRTQDAAQRLQHPPLDVRSMKQGQAILRPLDGIASGPRHAADLVHPADRHRVEAGEGRVVTLTEHLAR